MEKGFRNTLVWVACAGLFSACSSTPKPNPIAQFPADKTRFAEPTPVKEPPSATGNPEFYDVFGKRYFVLASSEGYRQTGTASWYGEDFHGKRTSSGPPFDMYAVTAAHKNLPLPTYARVTHLGNGRSIVVKINDRGPFVGDRLIDLSYAAAMKLGMVETGTAPVEVAALPPYQYLAGFSPGRSKRALANNKPSPRTSSVAYLPAGDAVSTGFAADNPPEQWLAASASNKTPPAAKPAEQRAAKPVPATLSAGYNPPSRASAAPLRPAGPLLYLQVGAFAERNLAQQLQQRLAPRLSQTILIDSTTGPLHKVRIGPLSNPDEAQQLASKLAGLGIKAHTVAL